MVEVSESEAKNLKSKKEILTHIAELGKVWSPFKQAAIDAFRHLGQIKIVAGAILYLYLSVVGIIYDLLFFRIGYGLDPFKYTNVEHFVFSAAKHWDVLLGVLGLVIGIPIFLVCFWSLLIALAWLMCWSTPENLKVPAEPPNPDYRTFKFEFEEDRDKEVWHRFWSNFWTVIGGVTTRALSNSLSFVRFLGAKAFHVTVSSVSRFFNVLIRVYSAWSYFPDKWLKPSGRALIYLAGVTCLVGAPTVGAVGLMDKARSKTPGEEGILCTRSTDKCETVIHIGSTGNYAFFQVEKTREAEESAKSNVAGSTGSINIPNRRTDDNQGEEQSGTVSTRAGLAEVLGFLDATPGRDTKSLRVIPLSNIASFNLHVDEPGSKGHQTDKKNDVESPTDLGKAIKKTREAILKRIDRIGSRQAIGQGTQPQPQLMSLGDLKRALENNSKEILARIDKMAGGSDTPAKAPNMTNLMNAVKNNNSAILTATATISGGPLVEGRTGSPKPISLAEVKKALDDNSREILGRLGRVDEKVAGHSEAASVAAGKVETALGAGKQEILSRIDAVEDTVNRHSKAAAEGTTRIEMALGTGKQEILGRIGAVEDTVDRHSKTAVEGTTRIETALDDGKQKILDRIDGVEETVDRHSETATEGTTRIEMALGVGKQEILGRIDTVEVSVDRHSEAAAEETARIETALDDSKQEILDRIDRFERDRPPNWYNLVTRYIVINRLQTGGAVPKIKTKHIYSLAGFKEGSDELLPYHRDWIDAFGKALLECSVDRPKFRIIGYSSTQPFPENININRTPNLCISEDGETDSDGSDENNCLLANYRASRVASQIISTIGDETNVPKNQRSKESILASMGKNCAETKGDVLRSSFINIKPWCEIGEMQRERFDTGSDDVKRQPNFLNRGVHVVILDSNNCPGF